MHKDSKNLNHKLYKMALLPTAVLSAGLTVSIPAAHATIANPEEVVVTARRTEEVIQNVPIAMTVFNQEMLDERNVTSGSDLATYTPSLSVNNRFGSDQASFAIRGFTQELRTTASVAVYFADVVAPRGSGNVTSGDGAGPGAFFDLQNVQVLKGPQGTLFGRNTTGGAIQLVPQEPTTKLEGYLEQSVGNYNMRRTQGVLNVPITDSVRARFGVDTQKRDGYLVNTTSIGPSRYADIDYLAGRASLMVDVTDSIQNYTIFSQTSSENNGSLQKLFACNPAGPFGNICVQGGSLVKQGDGFYSVSNGNTPDSVAKLKQQQLINTTTWNLSDALTVKNILSYADLKQDMRGAVAGANFFVNFGWFVGNPQNYVTQPLTYFASWQLPGVHTNSQATVVEELQASGTALDSKLTWQAGYYYESSRPDGWSGAQSPTLLNCDQASLGWDPTSWDCVAPIPGQGSVFRQLAKVEYNNQAIYSQATYDITDEFRATLGLRYTVDTTDAATKQTIYTGGGSSGASFPVSAACVSPDASLASDCRDHAHTKSEAPTWLIDFDYLPTPDIMAYAKYARGYRQGSIVTAAPFGYNTYQPEKVDAYELGAKTSFHGIIPGTFNVALFYNELTDQQLQLGLTPQTGIPGNPTTAIVNGGSSTIQGAEVETTLKLFDDLTFNLGYTYLSTRLDSLNYPTIVGWDPHPAAVEGGHLTFSPRHTVVTGLSYRLPLPAEIGDISAGASYTFTSSQLSAAPSGPGGSPFAELGARQMLNLNLGWKGVLGSPFDASLFMTNALNEKYYAFVAALYNGTGTEYGVPGEPKMWGARVKYRFQ